MGTDSGFEKSQSTAKEQSETGRHVKGRQEPGRALTRMKAPSLAPG